MEFFDGRGTCQGKKEEIARCAPPGGFPIPRHADRFCLQPRERPARRSLAGSTEVLARRSPDHDCLRACMSLRLDDERQALGNRVGAFNVALPVGEPDPLARLARIQRQTGAAKSDRRSAAYPLVMRALALMPGFAYRLLAQTVTGRINLICTNMPGPPAARYLAGAKVEAIYPFAPVALGTPLSIALMSYGDTYGIGVDSDPAAIPDPELLSRYLAAAFDEIEGRVSPPVHPTEPQRMQRVAPKPRRSTASSKASA
jgi:hypothetical protein